MIDTEELSGIPLFAELNEAEREEIATIVDKKEFLKDNIISGQNGSSGQLFVVKEGEAKVVREIRDNQHQTMGKLKSGEFIGRLSFIDGQKHPTKVVSTTDSVVLSISRNDFNELARKNPTLCRKILIPITATLCSYLRMLNSKVNDLTEYVTQSWRPA
jgi:CRP-like cAMP-binding protein